MSQIANFGRVLWTPYAISPEAPFSQPNKVLKWGLLAGFLGMIIQLVWIVPPGDILNASSDYTLKSIASKAIGGAMGFVFILLIWLIEVIYFHLFKIRKTKMAIFGGIAVFFFLPFVIIPLRGFYPNGIAASGNSWIIWMCIVFFLGWNVAWVGILMKHGHCQTLDNQPISVGKLSAIICVLMLVEVGLSIISLTYVPQIFHLTTDSLFTRWM
jgi:hypothetical protein